MATPVRARRRLLDSLLAALQRFAIHRAFECLGLALIALAFLSLVALFSYSPTDPSFSLATSKQPDNLAGIAGAYTADLLLKGLGAAAPVFVLPLMVWGASMTFLKGKEAFWRPLWAHALAWTAASLGFAALASALPLPGNSPLLGIGVGGLAGDLLYRALVSAFAFAGSIVGGILAGVLSALIGILAFGYAVGVSRNDVALLRMLTVNTARGGYSLLRDLLAEIWRLAARRVVPHLLGRPARTAPLSVEEQSGSRSWEHDFVPEPIFDRAERKAKKVVSRPESAPRKSGREREEAQTSLDFGDDGFKLPELSFLAKAKPVAAGDDLTDEALEQNARLLEGVLQDFGVKGEIINVRPGPVVTLYELEPAPGIKSSRVIGLADDIARSMSAVSARVAVVPGRNAIGIELPNRKRDTVFLRELLSSEPYERALDKLPLALGKTIGGEPVIADLTKMPHLLIAGTTGSGKSVAINTMILSLLYRLTPQQCKLIMIDPKMLELSAYDGIPHLLAPVVTEPKKAIGALKWIVREMEDRYRKMSKLGVRNIAGYNARIGEARDNGETLKRQVQTGFDRETGEPIYEEEVLSLAPMPFIVVIIDEMADLMMVAGKEIEGAVQRLAQMARAAGIHLIMATQRPSVDVITGTIKANFPTRISFQVTSKIDSRTILGEQGAEQLLGQGDMLYMAGGGRIGRVHGPFVSDLEVEKVVRFLKAQGTPEYLDAITEEADEESQGFDLWEQEGISDDLYDKAVAIVARDRKASTSYIQRKLQIGYNRAARLVERMEEEGVVSSANHAGKREILVGDHG